jgi:drug/metabolite transporter (DMT)-like permease
MVACLAFFCSIVAMLTLFAGMNILGPTKSSILSMIEPISTIILSTLLFAEKMSIMQIIGAIIVIFGTILVILAKDGKQFDNKVIHSKIS